MRVSILPLAFILCASLSVPADPWTQAGKNSQDASQAMAFSIRYMDGWLAHADPVTGLTPRRLNKDYFWNARDCAADNFPYLLLTAHMTGIHYACKTTEDMLQTEQRLTSRVDRLPDTYDFQTQTFLTKEPDMAEVLFGASEYAKDGLMPVTEWLGTGPWLERMQGLVDDLWKNAQYKTDHGLLPSANIEVLGNVMQVMSRLFWLTGDPALKERCYLVADYYLLHQPLLKTENIHLRDHGCEVIGGLAEVYVIAAQKDPEKHAAYRKPIHDLLDCVLAKGVNEDGMMPDGFNPATGDQDERLSDSWGYVYDAIYTVGRVDNHAPYLDATRRVLQNLYKYLGTDWEHGSSDGYADSIESAINLLNRFEAIPAAEQWLDLSVAHIVSKQQPDGISEAWYGDGNSARTLMMYALKKTQGVSAQPWNADIHIGAVRQGDTLFLKVDAGRDWHGILLFDRPRHKDTFHMPFDYPRINQFPEWFVVADDANYTVSFNGAAETNYLGKDLRRLPLQLTAGDSLQVVVRPNPPAAAPSAEPPAAPWRTLAIPTDAQSPKEFSDWQNKLRGQLMGLLGLDSVLSHATEVPLSPKTVTSEVSDGIEYTEIEIKSIRNKHITMRTAQKVHKGDCKMPAVVCIHGHGGTRNTPFEEQDRYKQFGALLAQAGFFCVAVDVGQHEPKGATPALMRDRILDLFRCVDYLESLSAVDASRIGCAGLSLGGEMAMWLGALDTRVNTTVSMGFLTYMSQMERNHCMCWKFDGLRELADFPDIYALIAPRSLQCQIGRLEPVDQFNPVLAAKAFEEIQSVYTGLGASGKARLDLHAGAHEVDLESLVAFLKGM